MSNQKRERMQFTQKSRFSEEALSAIEKELGVALPEDYCAFLRKYNGGRPANNMIKTTWKKDQNGYLSIRMLFGLNRRDGEDVEACCTDEWVPEQTVYIGVTFMGESLCLSMREGEFGKILVAVDGEIHLLADSFTDFLQMGEEDHRQDMVFEPCDYSQYFRENMLKAFEKEIGAALPEGYCQYLRTTNGGYPDKTFFSDASEALMVQFFCGIHMPESYLDLRKTYAECKDILPSDAICIGQFEGGDMILLGISGEKRDHVFWMCHEDEECELLSDSFAAFSGALQDVPEDF